MKYNEPQDFFSEEFFCIAIDLFTANTAPCRSWLNLAVRKPHLWDKKIEKAKFSSDFFVHTQFIPIYQPGNRPNVNDKTDVHTAHTWKASKPPTEFTAFLQLFLLTENYLVLQRSSSHKWLVSPLTSRRNSPPLPGQFRWSRSVHVPFLRQRRC